MRPARWRPMAPSGSLHHSCAYRPDGNPTCCTTAVRSATWAGTLQEWWRLRGAPKPRNARLAFGFLMCSSTSASVQSSVRTATAATYPLEILHGLATAASSAPPPRNSATRQHFPAAPSVTSPVIVGHGAWRCEPVTTMQKATYNNKTRCSTRPPRAVEKTFLSDTWSASCTGRATSLVTIVQSISQAPSTISPIISCCADAAAAPSGFWAVCAGLCPAVP